MSELEAFVKARLDEDEAAALLASPGPWHLNAEHDEVIAVDDIEVCTAFALSNNQLRNTARHIARYDPTQVLADIKFKRNLLELFAISNEEGFGGSEGWTLMRDAIYQLAALWSDHKDYNPEWRTK